MRQKLPHLFIWVLLILFLSNPARTEAQKLNAPELPFAYACVSESFNEFNAIISYEGSIFNTDNVFHIELSDASGSFSDPHILKSVSGENFSFDFETQFAFPLNVAGEHYRIRVRSTAPELISPPSREFNAFYIPSAQLILNNFQDVTACGESTATIALNVDVATSYIWYKNGAFYQEGGNSLEITSSGEYFVEAYFGDCTGILHSNIVIVNFGETMDIAIEGDTTISACPGTTQTLAASVDNEFLAYQWFRNGVALTNLPTYLPELVIEVTDNSYGVYSLEITNEGGCVSASDEVSLIRPTDDISVTAVSALETILLGDSPVTLRIATQMTNPRVSWFKGEELVFNGTSLEFNVTEAGTYHAKVSAPGSCLGLVESPEFSVYDPVSFTAFIETDARYVLCENTQTQLNIKSIDAIALNGTRVSVLPAQFDQFDYAWSRNAEQLDETGSFYIVENYLENGSFHVEITYDDEISFSSNSIDVRLALPEVILNSSSDIVCANSGSVSLEATTYENAIYSWFRAGNFLARTNENTFEINAQGTYHVEVALAGCSTLSNEVIISPLNEDAISVFPSTEIFIAPETSEVITASGGDAYLWRDAEGIIVSSSDAFIASEAGIYTLTATIDDCEVIREINVSILDIVEIPNIITPNQDNINDKWVLPARYVNDPDVEVVISDAYGKAVLKTTAYQNNWPENTLVEKNEASVYYYFIQAKGEEIRKGSITVVNR